MSAADIKVSKYYAVQRGRSIGVFYSWSDCRKQIEGFKGALYRCFPTEAQAMAFAYPAGSSLRPMSEYKKPLVAYTDGSYGASNHGGWGYVLLSDNTPILQAYGPCTLPFSVRNIGGEIEAVQEAVNKAVELGADYIRICHDYEGIGRWGNGEWNASKPCTTAYRDFISDKRKNITIEFTKVSGHKGIEYNELADRLASKGVTSREIHTSSSNLLSSPSKRITTAKASNAPLTLTTKIDGMSFSDVLFQWRKSMNVTQAEASVMTKVKSFASLERGEVVRLYPDDLVRLYSIILPKTLSFHEFVGLWAASTK